MAQEKCQTSQCVNCFVNKELEEELEGIAGAQQQEFADSGVSGGHREAEGMLNYVFPVCSRLGTCFSHSLETLIIGSISTRCALTLPPRVDRRPHQ
jgi:hypothetical protein